VTQVNKRPKFSLNQHITVAKDVRNFDRLWSSIFFEVQDKFGKSHRATRSLRRIHDALIQVRGALDTEYHRVATDDDYAKLGHVYYRGCLSDTEEPPRG